MKRLSKQNRILMSIVAVFIITIAFAIAYAAFSQTLNINGNGVVRNSSWDIHFVTNSTYVNNGYLRPSNTLSSSTRILTEPSISNTTIGDYSVSLTTPGDTIVYTFDVINEGDYNAKIAEFNLPSPSCTGAGESKVLDEKKVCGGEYNSETYQRQIEYTLKYEDGTPVSNNDPLLSKETKTLVLTLTYKEFNDANLLPVNDMTISNLGFTIKYVQDGNAKVNEDGSTPYILPTEGSIVTLHNEDYYVISMNGDANYATLLKTEPLTIEEVNLYGGVGTDNNHVNRYIGGIVGTASDQNGYGGMAYYTSQTCGKVNESWAYEGCTNDYNISDIKYVVDAWSNATFTLKELATDSLGYKVRLITKADLSILGCTNYDCKNSPHNWLYNSNSNYWYWTMSPYGSDGKIMWFVDSGGDVSNFAVNISSGVVRPVINVYKSKL